MLKLMSKDSKNELGILEENEGSNAQSESSANDERENVEKNADELLKLTSEMINHYDNSVSSITQPRTFEPSANEFDQLRKRVNYLTRKKRPGK